jgi:uncharacterized protein YgiM (DUF1202 family)
MKLPLFVVTAALLAATAQAAYAPGAAAYTKRIQTSLLSEPAPLATVVAKLQYARKLKVEEVRGAWVRVSDGGKTGWVFGGNLAEEKPAENSDALKQWGASASDTSASAAARPLVQGAIEYADRRGLGQARGDLQWMVKTTAAIPDADVTAYKQAQKKGEFQ